MRQKGFALIFVMMIISLLFIFAISLLGLSLSEARLSYAYAAIPKAQYLAESGLYKTRFLLESKSKDIENAISREIKKDNMTDEEKIEKANKVFSSQLTELEKNLKINQPQKVGNESGASFNIKEVKTIQTCDSNNYYKFTIHVRTEGIYQGITKKGNADIEFDFSKAGKDGLVNIVSWKIE